MLNREFSVSQTVPRRSISLQDCYPSTALEVLLPPLRYLSPDPSLLCNKLPIQNTSRSPCLNILFEAGIFSSHHKWWVNCLRGILHLEQCFSVRFEICALGSLGSNTARASCSTWRCLNSWWHKGHSWHPCPLIMCANCRCTPSQTNASTSHL